MLFYIGCVLWMCGLLFGQHLLCWVSGRVANPDAWRLCVEQIVAAAGIVVNWFLGFLISCGILSFPRSVISRATKGTFFAISFVYLWCECLVGFGC